MDAAIWRVYRSLGDKFTDALEDEKIAALLLEFVPNDCVGFQPRSSNGSGSGSGSGGESGLRQEGIEAIIEHIKCVKRDRRTLATLINLPAVAQRSEEWFNLRKDRLTASDAYKALSQNRTRDMLVRTKAFPETSKYFDSDPTRWGKVFEPMALRIYRVRNAQVVVYDFGLVPHPTLTCFGASPDGITATGVMVEIKCPYTREIKPGCVPDAYEVQMQGQMAVCGLTNCDYIECKLIRHDTKDAFAAAARRCKYPEDYGVVVTDNNGDALHYSPASMSPAECIEWQNTISGGSGTIMWTLGRILVQRVTFDSVRWDTLMVPKFKQFWADVVTMRATAAPGQRAIGAKDKQKVVEFIDSDDD